MKRPAKGLTIGIPKSFYVDDLEPDVAKALDDAIAVFKQLGVKVVQVDLPDQVMVAAAALIVLAVEATAYHAPWLRTRPHDYGAQVRNRLQNGLAYSAVEYLEALRWRGACARRASRGDRQMSTPCSRRCRARSRRRSPRPTSAAPAMPRRSSRASRASCGRSTISGCRRWWCRRASASTTCRSGCSSSGGRSTTRLSRRSDRVPGRDRPSHQRCRTLA